MAEVSRIINLADRIQSQVSQIHDLLAAAGQPDPGFDGDAPAVDFDVPGVQDVRSSTIDLIEELRDLLQTPLELLQSLYPTDYISRHALDTFHVHERIPVGTTKTYDELAKELGLPVDIVRRIVRHAMTQRIYQESEPGVIAHTQVSKLLTEDTAARDYMGTISNVVFSSAYHTAEAIKKWPEEAGNKDPEKSAFFLAYGKKLHTVLEENPEVNRRYDSTMSANKNNRAYSIDFIADNFDWASYGSGTVVDVAGGVGTVSRFLAKRFPDLDFVVQDQAEVIEGLVVEDKEIAPSIKFMEHNMFTPQPVKDADVYFFRRVFMEWTDDKAIDILRNLKPALKPGKSRVVIADFSVPDPGTTALWQERRMRSSDMLALAVANGGARSRESWYALFAQAGPGYRISSIKDLTDSDMMITEAIWEGE